MSIYNKMVESNPAHKKYIAALKVNYGNFWFDRNDTLKAINAYEEAVNLYATLRENNKIAFENNYLSALYSLGRTYFHYGQLDKAISILDTVIIAHKQRIKTAPFQYEMDIERALNTLATTYWAKKNYVFADSIFKEAIKWHKIILKTTPQYKSEICKTYFNLGLFYQEQKKYEHAENQYFKAVDARRPFAEKEPSVYGENHQVTLMTLINLYNSMRLTEQNERKIKLWSDNQTKYRHEMVDLQIKIVNAYEKAAINGKHPKLNEAYEHLAVYYLAINNIKKAEIAAKKQQLNTADFLIFIHLIQDKYKEAEALLTGIPDKITTKYKCLQWTKDYFNQKVINNNTRNKINNWLE